MAVLAAGRLCVVSTSNEWTGVDAAGTSCPLLSGRSGVAREDAGITEQTLGQTTDHFEDIASAITASAHQFTAVHTEVVCGVGYVGKRQKVLIGILFRWRL